MLPLPQEEAALTHPGAAALCQSKELIQGLGQHCSHLPSEQGCDMECDTEW